MFACPQREPRVLLLGGRSWLVTHVDWRRRVAYVEASEERGLSRWQGTGRSLSYRLCQAMKAVLAGGGIRDCWSRRAREAFTRLRSEFSWVASGETAVVRDGAGDTRWWTFAGAATNAVLAQAVAHVDGPAASFDNLSLTLDREASHEAMRSSVERIRAGEAGLMLPRIDRGALEGLKFSDCLPEHLGISILQKRICEEACAATVLEETVQFIGVS